MTSSAKEKKKVEHIQHQRFLCVPGCYVCGEICNLYLRNSQIKTSQHRIEIKTKAKVKYLFRCHYPNINIILIAGVNGVCDENAGNGIGTSDKGGDVSADNDVSVMLVKIMTSSMCTGVFVLPEESPPAALTVQLCYFSLCYSLFSLSVQIDLEPEGKVYVVIDLSGSSTEGKTMQYTLLPEKNKTNKPKDEKARERKIQSTHEFTRAFGWMSLYQPSKITSSQSH